MLADSNITIEELAVGVDFAADSVLVEDEALRTGHAESVFPLFASEVIVDHFHEVGVVVLGAQGCDGLGREDLGQVHHLRARQGGQ